MLLEPGISQVQAQIRLLAEKSPLSSSKETILQNYRHNLELYQEMLTGERRYAPVQIWRQIEAARKSLLELEASLAKNETI